jgi:hypothetical protein
MIPTTRIQAFTGLTTADVNSPTASFVTLFANICFCVQFATLSNLRDLRVDLADNRLQLNAGVLNPMYALEYAKDRQAESFNYIFCRNEDEKHLDTLIIPIPVERTSGPESIAMKEGNLSPFRILTAPKLEKLNTTRGCPLLVRIYLMIVFNVRISGAWHL